MLKPITVPLVPMRDNKRRTSQHGNQLHRARREYRTTRRDFPDQIYRSEGMIFVAQELGHSSHGEEERRGRYIYIL